MTSERSPSARGRALASRFLLAGRLRASFEQRPRYTTLGALLRRIRRPARSDTEQGTSPQATPHADHRSPRVPGPVAPRDFAAREARRTDAPATQARTHRGVTGWRFVLLTVAFGLTTEHATAVLPSASPATDAERQRVIAQIDEVGRRGFLYEVSRPSSASGGPGSKLFLYGTIHLGRVGSEPFNPPLVKALRGSWRLLLEADPTDGTAAKALAMTLGRYPDGDGLERHVSPELWLRVRTFGARLGLEPERVGRFRPWLLANMVALTELSGAGLDPMLGSELYLTGFARSAGMPITEIEGLETQLRFLAALPEPVQTAQLDEALTDAVADVRAESQALFALWLHGDRAAGDTLVARMHRDAEGRIFERYFVDTLIDERNRAMTDKAEACFDEPGDTFFAVGSLHLFGEAGLLRALERRGYRVVDLQPADSTR